MISRFFQRVAVLWLMFWGVILMIGLSSGTRSNAPPIVFVFFFGMVPAFLFGLAWLFAPRRR
jgi:hypothetical protein